MAKIISIANQKGGVGKTTTTYNLAAAKAKKAAAPILMIDLDPQYSLTEYCKMVHDASEYNGMSTCKLFQREIDPLDCCFEVEPLAEKYDLFIVPSTQDLAVTGLSLYNNKELVKVFKGKLEKLKEYFSYIFIDCPPALDMLLTSALFASDEVVITTKPERLSCAGLKLITGTIASVQDEKNELNNTRLKVSGVIATMHRSVSREHNEYTVQLASDYNLLGIVPQSTMVTKEVEHGLPVVIAHGTCKAAKAYTDIANKL
ncbi:MAG: ParA family protein [Parasporobacterium sp.]|nr:ParA family protein [Parasporobacterium sp.]